MLWSGLVVQHFRQMQMVMMEGKAQLLVHQYLEVWVEVEVAFQVSEEMEDLAVEQEDQVTQVVTLQELAALMDLMVDQMESLQEALDKGLPPVSLAR